MSLRMTVVGSCVVLVLCSVVLQVTGTKNGWAPQWMHDRFCDGRHEYVSLPWDCSGYIHCGDKSSHWLNCAPTLKFNNQSQTCDLKSPSCENPETVATKWCQVYSTLKFAHPHSCSLYYDCSKNTPSPEYGLKVYEKECKWPTLFDPIEMVCREDTFNTIVCDKRPVSRCDYVTECTTPESFNDACVSLPDGPHAEHSAPFSTTFVRCVGQRVQEKVTCDTGEVFDTGISNCTGNFENSVNEYCRNNPTAVFADPFDCALFYNCSAIRHRFGLEEYQAECRYMHLFDMKTNTCVDFADLKASCGTRREPKAPCDYRVNDCTADGCTPCSASCVGLPDGDVPYPNMHFTRFYLNCRGGRTVKIKRCTIPRIFSIAQRTCANPEDVDRSATLPPPAAVTTTVSTASPTTSTVSIPSPTTAHSTTDSSSTTPAGAASSASTPSSVSSQSSASTASSATITPTSSTTAGSTSASTTVVTTPQSTTTTSSTIATTTAIPTTTTTTTTTATTTQSPSTTTAPTTTPVTTTPSSTTTPTSTAPTTPFTVNPSCGCKPELSPIVRTLNEVLPKVNALSARMDNEARPPFSCDTPPTLAASHVKLSYAPDNAVATYPCDEGHAPCFAGMTSTCSSDNMWTLQSLGQCVQNTWTNQPAQVGARTLCPPRPGSVWAFTGRYTRDKSSMAISSNETSTDILSITVIPRGKKVAFQALKSDITTVPSPVDLTGDLDWTVELRETSFEVAVNGHFVASIPHSEPVNRMDTLIFTDSFPTSRIVFHLNGDPHNTPGKYAIRGNLAFKKKTSSSSSRVGHPSSRVTDGMTIVDWQQESCWSVSEGDSNPWWMVDLGSVYYINHLVLTSRHCDSTCANRLHDFEIEVFKEDPSVNTTAVGVRCTMYVGAVPDGTIQKVECDEEVVGRFVRISGRNPADNADVLTLCEVEVYGGMPRTGWSPFKCPNPPLLTGAAVTVSHTNTRAVAEYTCSHGAMVCAGHDVIHCSSQAGWDREPGSCVQTSQDAGKPGSLEDFPICPLALGGSLELWVTPTEDEGSLILHGESGATLSGSMTLQNATAPVSLSFSVSGTPSPAVYPASNPFTKNKESHIVISHLTESLLIEVDGATLYNYPIDDFSSVNVNVVTWTAGLSVRKATFSQTMGKELDRERVQFNMALNAFVDASSTDNVPTSYGVDGDPNMTSTIDTDNDSCWRGQESDHEQWYQVDLGKQVYIRDIGINIKNQCITCASRLHDFSVLVYALNPETETGVAGTLCTRYAGDVPSDAPITLTCRDGVWGRYVRVTADHAGQMSICEIEIYGDSVVRKEWSPLDCGPAPMAGKARVSIASSTRESVASYSCPEGMSLYEGTPTLVCDSSKGWVGQVGTCLQTTFRATGTDLLQQVQLLSPPRIGEAVEVVFTPRNPWLVHCKDPESRVSLIASSVEQDVVLMVIEFTKDRAKLISGGTSAVVAIPGFPFQDGKRTKVLFTFFSQYIDISVDGRSVYAYPFLFPVDLIDGVFTTGATRVSVLPTGITGTTWTQLTRNLAWNKPAVGSTANGESDPGNAVDGNKAMQLTSQSCWSVDNGDLDPWWTVDLGSFYKVTHVEITSRVSCGELCDKRLHDFKIELFNKQPLARDKGELCLQHDGVFPPATTKTLTCTTTAVGRYLRISSPGRTDGEDLFTLCEVLVFGDEFIKEESSQSDCKEPPPRPHATVSVMRTGRGVTASYSCEAGYALCGERQHSTCVDGIWGEFNGHCFQNVWHYSTPHTVKDHPLTCPLSLNSEVTLIATPVINTDFTTSLRIGNTSIIKLEASFTAYGYKEATVQVQESGRETYRYRLPIFPFDIGKEFTLLMKVLPAAIELHVDGRMVHDPSLPGIPVETRMDGPPVLNTEGLATRRLTYHVSNERYHMIHYTHTENRWIHVSTKDRTDIMFSVKACHSVLVNLREDRFFETPGVTFTIGGRQNTMSECTSCSNNQTTWHSVLDCETYKTFWVSWKVPGSVAIGSGKILDAEVFMTSSGHDFRKGFLRLGTTDTDGQWTFPEYESGAAPDQPCPRPDQSPSTYITSNFLAPTPYRMSTFRCSEGHVFCGQSSQASCQDSTDLQVFKGACVSNVLPREDAVKTKLRLPCRMENGALISVFITPNTDASRITVDVDGEYDTGLLLKLDFNARDLTAAHSGALEQSIGSFPFTRGQEFHLVIAFEPDRYQIYSDGQWVGVHASPVTHDRLSDVEVSGDFTLRDLRAYPNIMSSPDNCVVDVTHGTIQSRDTSIGSEGQVKCNTNYKTCNTSSVVCGPDGKYGNTEDQTCRQYKWQFTAELTTDTDYPVPCTLRDGYGIRLIGKASRSFHVRVRAGPEDQIAFFSDMTASTTTLSTSVKDEVLFQEVIPRSPLSLYTQFVLIIEVHPDVYKVILNGDVINSYTLLSPADRAEQVTITAGVAVTDLEFLDR